MGMTDRQFDSYTKRQLQILEKIQSELAQQGVTHVELDKLVEDLQNELKRP